MDRHDTINCWIMTDGKIGTENQAIGLAEACKVQPTIIRLKPRHPWRLLPPNLWFLPHPSCDNFPTPPWPDLLIAASRVAVAPARYIKSISPETKVIFLQNPRHFHRQYDLIVAPEHDKISGHNIIRTTGALNRINEDILDTAQNQFSKTFDRLPHPLVGVLIGGRSKHYDFTIEDAKQILAQLLTCQQQTKCGFIITISRRTPPECAAIIQQGLQNISDIFIWDGTGNNPYFGILACADYLLVSADSISMISEATSTGKPVYILPLPGRSKKFESFHQSLENGGITKVFAGTLEKWSYQPLRDTQRVASYIDQQGWLSKIKEI